MVTYPKIIETSQYLTYLFKVPMQKGNMRQSGLFYISVKFLLCQFPKQISNNNRAFNKKVYYTKSSLRQSIILLTTLHSIHSNNQVTSPLILFLVWEPVLPLTCHTQQSNISEPLKQFKINKKTKITAVLFEKP